MVCGTNPCAWRVTAGSVRTRRRATANDPAPTPMVGRWSNTRSASRQYFPRVDSAAKTRSPPSSGATSVSLVSSETLSSNVPDNPRSEKATEVKATSGTTQATTTATSPMRRWARTGTTPRTSPTFTA